MEMMFVMGKRTRSRCQATGSAAPVPMAASTSAEAGLEKEQPTQGCSLLGGPPSPHGAVGVAQPLPQGSPQRQSGEMGLCPLPCLLGGPCLGPEQQGGWAGLSGSPVPAEPMETFCRASSYGFGQCRSAAAEENALAAQTQVRGCHLHGGACRAPCPPSAHILRGVGACYPSSAARSPTLPAHPSPACGMASLRGRHDPAAPSLAQFSPCICAPKETTPFSSSSLLHLQPPVAGVKGGERKRDPRLVLAPVWGGGAIVISADGVRRDVLYSTLLVWVMNFFPQALLPSATQLVSCGYNRFYS